MKHDETPEQKRERLRVRQREYRRAYDARNPEKRRARRNRSARKNRESANARTRRYQEANREMLNEKSRETQRIKRRLAGMREVPRLTPEQKQERREMLEARAEKTKLRAKMMENKDAWEAQKRENRQAYSRKYYAENRERLINYQREYEQRKRDSKNKPAPGEIARQVPVESREEEEPTHHTQP